MTGNQMSSTEKERKNKNHDQDSEVTPGSSGRHWPPHGHFSSGPTKRLCQHDTEPTEPTVFYSSRCVYTTCLPRLSLSGCAYEDGYNGNVEWVTAPNGEHIQTWGEMWELCGTEVFLYLSWYDPGYQNKLAATIQPHVRNQGVNYSHPTFANAGHIGVTLCAEWFNQWKCGAPQIIRTEDTCFTASESVSWEIL